jgi:hypothetical protein
VSKKQQERLASKKNQKEALSNILKIYANENENNITLT